MRRMYSVLFIYILIDRSIANNKQYGRDNMYVK